MHRGKERTAGRICREQNGNYVFTRISVISTDGEQSVIEDATFIDAEGNQVYTVDVYDEVLKHPDSALESDLKKGKDTKKENGTDEQTVSDAAGEGE